MKKLFVVRTYDYDYDEKSFDGYVIVERKDDDEYYAKVWNRRLAVATAKAIGRLLK